MTALKKCATVLSLALPCGVSAAGERLYNGIVLPDTWPPHVKMFSRQPATPPYLASPPDVIPIDVGRQLFVDDFLIQETTLTRVLHKAEYYEDNPILVTDREWEKADAKLSGTKKTPEPTAMVFSDGVWYDPGAKIFKMWYMGGYCAATCYATSEDGIHWTKPELNIVPGTNVVLPEYRDSTTVWMDLNEKDPDRRFKLAGRMRGTPGLAIYFSRDGIHWGNRVANTGPAYDRSTFFYNPFRKVWVFNLKAQLQGFGRIRRYHEGGDILAAARWQSREEPLPWVGEDNLDKARPGLGDQTFIYNLDCVAYESVMLGLFAMWRGQPPDRPKQNELVYGFSRDGWHWVRPLRDPFIGISDEPGAWNRGNVQAAGGCVLVVGDKLYFYVSGRAGDEQTSASGVSRTGLATMRRDGFASMDAGEAEGTLTTRKVRFGGKHLFVNVDAPQGELRVEVLDEAGNTIASFTRDHCALVSADQTLQAVNWRGVEDLSAIAGKTVRLRFHLRNGKLYAFWVSPDASGASHGYVGAGGPGLSGRVDLAGAAAYRAAQELR